MVGWGTFFNVTFVIIGAVLGLRFKNLLPDRYGEILMQAIGLFIMFIGLTLIGEGNQEVVLFLALIFGVILGELFDIDGKINRVARTLSRDSKKNASRGFVTASLLFCVGPMAIVGSLTEGLTGDFSILLTKAFIDGIASVPMAAALGGSVAFASLPLLLYQGGITGLAFILEPLFTDTAVAEITALGGIILIAMGIDIMGLKKIRVANFLPALPILILTLFILGL